MDLNDIAKYLETEEKTKLYLNIAEDLTELKCYLTTHEFKFHNTEEDNEELIRIIDNSLGFSAMSNPLIKCFQSLTLLCSLKGTLIKLNMYNSSWGSIIDKTFINLLKQLDVIKDLEVSKEVFDKFCNANICEKCLCVTCEKTFTGNECINCDMCSSIECIKVNPMCRNLITDNYKIILEELKYPSTGDSKDSNVRTNKMNNFD